MAQVEYFGAEKQRHRRVRLLVKKLNKKRKQQAKKIDILCNDFISAQRDFIKNLKTISFIANFYESLIGITDLNSLLCTGSQFIKAEYTDAAVTFFLRRSDLPPRLPTQDGAAGNFELYMFESAQPIALEKQHLENCFSAEVMDNICKSNKVCTLDDMFAMGLQGNLIGLNNISGVTIPLGLHGSSLGFILICRPVENQLTAEEINNISAVTCGLSRAIQSCQTTLHSAD